MYVWSYKHCQHSRLNTVCSVIMSALIDDRPEMINAFRDQQFSKFGFSIENFFFHLQKKNPFPKKIHINAAVLLWNRSSRVNLSRDRSPQLIPPCKPYRGPVPATGALVCSDLKKIEAPLLALAKSICYLKQGLAETALTVSEPSIYLVARIYIQKARFVLFWVFKATLSGVSRLSRVSRVINYIVRNRTYGF